MQKTVQLSAHEMMMLRVAVDLANKLDFSDYTKDEFTQLWWKLVGVKDAVIVHN